MSVALNHIIVHASDNRRSAHFLAHLLGRPEPTAAFGHFEVVELDNGVSMDFMTVTGPIVPQHFAFLVAEHEFDAAFGRIEHLGLAYWADPGRTQLGAINHRDGGRGVYFPDPDGHLLELLTRPYGAARAGGTG